jgi:hypothetical protein
MPSWALFVPLAVMVPLVGVPLVVVRRRQSR